MENSTKKIKIFISYTHSDEAYLNEFKKFFSTEVESNEIVIWSDREIYGGSDFMKQIHEEISSADIILLFTSINSLNSNSCKDEVNTAISQKTEKGIEVIPVILSESPWKTSKHFPSNLLAIPKDGKPISSYSDKSIAWMDIYESLKKVIGKIKNTNYTTPEFCEFLSDTDLLAKAHPNCNNLLLDDIYVDPVFLVNNESSSSLKGDLLDGANFIDFIKEKQKIIVSGDCQSGKTALCKHLYLPLKEHRFMPIYINNRSNLYKGRINNLIINNFLQQYPNLEERDLDKTKVVLFLDDFYYAKKPENILKELEAYTFVVLICDDVFNYERFDNHIFKNYISIIIQEFSPTKRDKIIRKWNSTREEISGARNIEIQDARLNRDTEIVDTALGKIFNHGIMPAYPFYILSILNAHNAYTPLSDITSYGHCYQILIYMYLTNQNVKPDDFDTYYNFLTKVAAEMFKHQFRSLEHDVFEKFINEYIEKYNLYIPKNELLKNLHNAKIFEKDALDAYRFTHEYIYFYFIAKHFAENYNQDSKTVNNLLHDLHNNDNAYITIFINHHVHNTQILKELVLIAKEFFKDTQPATLDKDTCNKLDNDFIQKIKPSIKLSPLSHDDIHKQELKNRDTEEAQSLEINEDYNDDIPLARDLRRSLKTLEVMGQIIKSRAGSLTQEELTDVMFEAININLRIMQVFLNTIESEEDQADIVEYIAQRFIKIHENSTKVFTSDKIYNLSALLFSNLIFYTLHAILYKTAFSLGSSKLTAISEKVCDGIGTPASFLISYMIQMKYTNKFNFSILNKKFNDKDFSSYPRIILTYFTANHLNINKMPKADRQKICQLLQLETRQDFKETNTK